MTSQTKKRPLRAKSARYDSKADTIVVQLKNDAFVGFPRKKLRALRNATSKQAARIQIIGRGADLFWPDLDDGIEVSWIIEQVLGGRATA